MLAEILMLALIFWLLLRFINLLVYGKLLEDAQLDAWFATLYAAMAVTLDLTEWWESLLAGATAIILVLLGMIMVGIYREYRRGGSDYG